MCTNGVNVDQFKMMLEQMDDQVALNRRWTHKLFHKADDNGYENTAAVLKEIQGLMDDALDKDASSAPGVTVNLV